MTLYYDLTAEQAAAGGAEWLDVQYPDGWAEKIDLGHFSMAAVSSCVFGQLTGATRVSDWRRKAESAGLDEAARYRLGFSRHMSAASFNWNELTAAWRVEIEKRLSPPASEPAPKLRVADVATAYGVDFDELVRKHADRLGKVYENRTAGDHTWVGALMMFVSELEGF